MFRNANPIITVYFVLKKNKKKQFKHFTKGVSKYKSTLKKKKYKLFTDTFSVYLKFKFKYSINKYIAKRYPII